MTRFWPRGPSTENKLKRALPKDVARSFR